MKPVEYRHSWSSGNTIENEMGELFGVELANFDTSDGYDKEESYLFKKDDEYTWLSANGCSCWDGDWDGWQVNLEDLKKLASKEIEHAYRDSADKLIADWITENL